MPVVYILLRTKNTFTSPQGGSKKGVGNRLEVALELERSGTGRSLKGVCVAQDPQSSTKKQESGGREGGREVGRKEGRKERREGGREERKRKRKMRERGRRGEERRGPDWRGGSGFA